MEDPEVRLRLALQALPVGARPVEHHLRADHVGAHERARIGDRAIDVALGGQMHHGLRLELGVEGVDAGRVADVGLFQAVARVVLQRLERDRVGRIGHRIERQHLVAEILHEVQHQRGADEAAAAGHEIVCHPLVPCRLRQRHR